MNHSDVGRRMRAELRTRTFPAAPDGHRTGRACRCSLCPTTIQESGLD